MIERTKSSIALLYFSITLLLRTTPFLSSIFLLLIIFQGIIPTISVITSIALGDSLSQGDEKDTFFYCIIWAFTLIIPSIISPIVGSLQGLLNQRATYLAQRRIMEASASISDLKMFESPELHDTLDILSKEAAHRPLNLLVNLVEIFRSSITLFSLYFVISSVSWWLALALFIPIIPVTISVSASQLDGFRTILGKGRTARLIRYYLSLFMDTTLAKEIRMLRISDFLIKKHQEAFNELDEGMKKVRIRQALSPQLWNLIYMISAGGVMWWFSNSIISGKISVGGLLGTIQSISYFGGSCQWMVYAISNLGLCLNFFKKLMDLESISKNDINAVVPPFPCQNDDTIKFEGVYFSYDGMNDVLKNITFTIQKGEHISLVGENGAGKSTIVKLLCGLYKPTKGRITVNDIDIDLIDKNIWWSKFSTVFQDFGKYNLSIRENIAIGNIGSSNDDGEIIAVCNAANFKLNENTTLDSFIGKEYAGTELSGGQWQRLALARALLSNREIIILDEPTSSMDPRVEHALFNKFSELVNGKTSVVVTHRLGTVKYSDKVIVLKNGAIVEQGSIDELESLNGEYSELYRLQKSQYI